MRNKSIVLAVRRYLKRFVSATQRATIYKKLSKMLNSGVTLKGAIEDLLRREREARGNHSPRAILLEDCRFALLNGRGLTHGLEGSATDNERLLIQAGETSGYLTSVLEEAAMLNMDIAEIQRTAFQALFYPVFLVVALFAAVYVVSSQVVPTVVDAFPREQLNSKIVTLDNFSHFVVSEWGVASALVIVMAFLGVVFSFQKWTGKARVYADKVPPWSIYRLIFGTSWLLSFSAMLRSGLTQQEVLNKFLQRTDNRWARERNYKILKGLKSGGNLGEALEKAGCEFPDKEIINDLKIYTKYDGQENAVNELAKQWKMDGLFKLKKAIGLFSGIIFFSMCGGVLYFASAIIGLMDMAQIQGGF